MTSSVKVSMPQLVWWMTNHSRVPSSLWEITSERIASLLARPPAFPDHVGVALGQAGELRRVEPGVHAREDRKPPGGWHGELTLVAKPGGIGAVGSEHFIEHVCHGWYL